MKTLYLECYSGISGDMITAALLDLGADEEKLRNALSGIPDKGFEIEISRVEKSGIDCCDFNVKLDHEHENHDHDMEYLYGHIHGRDFHDQVDLQSGGMSHSHGDPHVHGDLHAHVDPQSEGDPHDLGNLHGHGDLQSGGMSHNHGDPHDHDNPQSGEMGHGHDHVHRNLRDVLAIIDGLDITDGARNLSEKVFQILAEAESKAHNRPVDKVFFHEVGALDSIADIVAAAVCFDDLGITEVIIPRICDGTGTVRCRHGILPVPVPAVLNISEKYGLPLSITERQGEYVTPTGAAFAAAVMTSTVLPEVLKIEKTGLGAGKREHSQPGILRAILLK